MSNYSTVMPAVSLILDKLKLAYPAEKLSLSLDSSISLRCPNDSVCSLDLTQLLGLISSGKVWVTRGNGCRFDFTIHCEGQYCDELSMKSIIEDLSHYIRDAPFWPLLALDAKLDLPQMTGRPGLEPSFSISFNHSMYGGISDHSGFPLSPSSANVQAPIGFLGFQLQKVKIAMIFKISRLDPGKTYNVFQAYSESMAATSVPTSAEEKRNPNGDPSSSTNYLVAHQAALTLSRVRGPISGASSNDLMCHDDEMLNDYHLLYNVDGARPSLTSQSLTQSSSLLPSPPESQEDDMKDISAHNNTNSILFNFSCARRMTDLALRTLIGGRQIKGQPGVKVRRPQPKQTISQIAPSLFNPGYLEAISQRARFVPTISHALSTSLLRNVQSPGLRRKLLDLASKRFPRSDTGVVMDLVDDMDGHTSEASQKLGQVVDEGLWTMMQRSLYDPLSARRLPPPKEDDTCGYEVAEDELVDICTGLEGTDRVVDNPPFPESQLLEDDFDDLFDNIPDEEDNSEFEDLCYEYRSIGLMDEFEDLFEDRQLDGLGDIFQPIIEYQDIDMDESTHHGVHRPENMGDTTTDALLNEVYVDEHESSYIENQSMFMLI